MTIWDELGLLSVPGPGYKPHKHLLLLAVIRLKKRGQLTGLRVQYDAALKNEFSGLISEHGGVEDRDRPYNPFFHLRGSSFWKLLPVPGQEAKLTGVDTIGGPGELIELVQCAELVGGLPALLGDSSDIAIAESRLLDLIAQGMESRSQRNSTNGSGGKRAFARLALAKCDDCALNPFVSYLNSLQRLNASNENALAENQARSPFFPLIHVSHPLTEAIIAELTAPSGCHVILTGHAGDGKSTIALDVFRHFAKLPTNRPLNRNLMPREDLPDSRVTIIKDLSERNKSADAELVKELIAGKRRFLIVSNTGALLDLLRLHAAAFGLSSVQSESDVLSAISAETGKATLAMGPTRFFVANLARLDNLEIARQVFLRMLKSERWAECAGRSCRATCPICLNVDLINNHQQIVVERIFLAYRRMYEYGSRLTLRQLTEHLAYLITSGLEESDIALMRAKGQRPLRSEFMFFNRFFGDNGKTSHVGAQAMRAVQDIRRQGFGERPCPTWERKLWLRLRGDNFRLGVDACEDEFQMLRNHGAGPGDSNQPGLTPDQARAQVRRMLYFLYSFPKDEESFLKHYLNSPTILRWKEWQEPDAHLEMTERNTLEQRIYHVLQEHFTGVRLPEGAKGHDRRLYITLSRGKNLMRQSAQVVIAQVDWSNEIALLLIRNESIGGGTRTDLQLQGRGRIDGAGLVLTLPFLDYVLMRHFGEVGQTLQPAYVERLERFKAQVQDLAKEDRQQVMLVRLKTDHTFRRQQFTVRDGTLEVNDVL